jgi:phosphoribosyl 1,2-cyclic phosphodiesterase
MALYISSLNSGSNGNCYYVGNDHEAVLIDAGLSCKETEKRMQRSGLAMNKVKAIFVSHEHTDHIKGVEVLSKKYQLPVYITGKTHVNSRMTLHQDMLKPFASFEQIRVGGLTIQAFPKFHDACEPHSFIVSGNDVCIGVFTDLGVPCEQLIAHFKQCHAAFLEANYDEQMLMGGRYPYHLKRRISGGMGHLSNRQALDVFKKHKPSFMSHLLLAHLSKENNCPDLVRELFSTFAGDTKVVVAPRYNETDVYYISNNAHTKTRHKTNALQLSMF